MKILAIILILILTGCTNTIVPAVYTNVEEPSLPDDPEFVELVQTLDTPYKICLYLNNEFLYKGNTEFPNPYEFWLTKRGDCDDYSAFATLVANFHGYETYQIIMCSKESCHALAVYVVDGKLNYSNFGYYRNTQVTTFKEVVLDGGYRLKYDYFIVYNYEMEIVETGVLP
jgi:hypothetical protein